ncbi:TPA: hypothetical protein HA242_00030 [Candidatus Woesearchaeota archaeon]|nr:hypothetical protein [Candidatus Woesearchaeota archaeon]HIH12093.1 hypothetical protein [Candidatus Woesearchaeota archaeon]
MIRNLDSETLRKRKAELEERIRALEQQRAKTKSLLGEVNRPSRRGTASQIRVLQELLVQEGEEVREAYDERQGLEKGNAQAILPARKLDLAKVGAVLFLGVALMVVMLAAGQYFNLLDVSILGIQKSLSSESMIPEGRVPWSTIPENTFGKIFHSLGQVLTGLSVSEVQPEEVSSSESVSPLEVDAPPASDFDTARADRQDLPKGWFVETSGYNDADDACSSLEVWSLTTESYSGKKAMMYSSAKDTNGCGLALESFTPPAEKKGNNLTLGFVFKENFTNPDSLFELLNYGDDNCDFKFNNRMVTEINDCTPTLTSLGNGWNKISVQWPISQGGTIHLYFTPPSILNQLGEEGMIIIDAVTLTWNNVQLVRINEESNLPNSDNSSRMSISSSIATAVTENSSPSLPLQEDTPLSHPDTSSQNHTLEDSASSSSITIAGEDS